MLIQDIKSPNIMSKKPKSKTAPLIRGKTITVVLS